MGCLSPYTSMKQQPPTFPCSFWTRNCCLAKTSDLFTPMKVRHGFPSSKVEILPLSLILFFSCFLRLKFHPVCYFHVFILGFLGTEGAAAIGWSWLTDLYCLRFYHHPMNWETATWPPYVGSWEWCLCQAGSQHGDSCYFVDNCNCLGSIRLVGW